MDLHWPCSCTAQGSILSISSVSVAFLWGIFLTILDSSCFPLFHSGQVFHQLVCPLTVVPPQIFFNLTTLFSYPVFFSLFHAPLDVVVHFLVFCSSFRLKSFLSQFSPFVAQIENFCSYPGFFLLTMLAKDLTGCFSHRCVEGGDLWIYVCIVVAHDGERCKPPAYHSLLEKPAKCTWGSYCLGVILACKEELIRWMRHQALRGRSLSSQCSAVPLRRFYFDAIMADRNDSEPWPRWHGRFVSEGERKCRDSVSLALKDTRLHLRGNFHWALVFFDRSTRHRYWRSDSKLDCREECG